MNEHLVFILQDKHFAISIRYLQELSRHKEITHVPGLGYPFKGVINLRGRVLPLLDMAEFLKLPSANNNISEKKVIIFNYHNHCFAAEVEHVEGVISIHNELFTNAEGITSMTPFIKGFYKISGEKIIQVIDTDALMEEICRYLGSASSEYSEIVSEVDIENITKRLRQQYQHEQDLQKILSLIEEFCKAARNNNLQQAERTLLKIKEATAQNVHK